MKDKFISTRLYPNSTVEVWECYDKFGNVFEYTETTHTSGYTSNRYYMVTGSPEGTQPPSCNFHGDNSFHYAMESISPTGRRKLTSFYNGHHKPLIVDGETKPNVVSFNARGVLEYETFHLENRHSIDKIYDCVDGVVFLREEAHFDSDGEYHREGGPSVIYYSREGNVLAEMWYKNGVDITRAMIESEFDPFTWSML